MKKKSYLILCLAAVIMLTACGSQKVSDKGWDAQEPRIVALSVALVEILSELNIQPVGVPDTQYTLTDKVKDVTRVGLPMAPDLERIASLNPTHVLSLTTLKSMVSEKLSTIGIEGTYLNAENIDTFKESVISIGKMFNREEEALKLIGDFEAKIDQTVESVKGKTKPKVLILFGFPGNYMAGTKASFVGQMVELLGGINIVTESSSPYLNMNPEALVMEQPDIILRMTHGVKEEVLEMFEKEFNENPIWSKFEAVKNQKVYDLDDAMFNVSASLQTADALKELAQIIYE